MAFMAQQMDALGLPYQRLEAVTPDAQSGSHNAVYWASWQRPLKETEKACFLSHVAAWERVAALEEPALILEDDVVLSRATQVLLKSCRGLVDVDHLTLEVRQRRKIVAKDAQPLTDDHVMRRLYQDRSGAAAYVLWPSGAAKLLQRAKTQAALADAMICGAYELKSYQVEPACAIQIDQAEAYGVAVGLKTHSLIGAGVPTRQPTTARFKLRRIAAQLRMGMQALLHAMDAERREISLSPAEFYTAPQEPRR